MSQTDIRQQTAQRRIKEFERKFGRNTLHFAYHAALPVALNSDLLHLLRINFFLDLPKSLPYMAELDLLLSSLCHEIGDELYQIDSTVRNELLKDLESEYGHERLREVAGLLWEYTERRAPWADDIRLERAQQLIALNVLAPERAKEWLRQVERQLERGSTEEREWVMAMRQEVENVRQLILQPERAEQSLQEAEKYLGGATREEREWVMATRQEVENVRQLQIKNLPLNEIIRGSKQNKPRYAFELFRRVFDENDQEAANELYMQYHRRVFHWAYQSLRGYRIAKEDIEDIVSEATMKFFTHSRHSAPLVSRYEHVAQLLGYWRTCIRTTVIDFQRKKARQERIRYKFIEEILVSSASLSEKEAEQEQWRQQINELLEKHFSDEERLMLQLKFVDGLTPRQMAQRYPDKFPTKTQYKIWDRIKKRLRKLFETYLE